MQALDSKVNLIQFPKLETLYVPTKVLILSRLFVFQIIEMFMLQFWHFIMGDGTHFLDWRLSNTFDGPTDKIFWVKSEVFVNMDPGDINQNLTLQTLVKIYQQSLGKK